MKKIFFFILLFSLSCISSPPYTHIKVVEVIDGDTVRLADGNLLRYIGIDTPEMRIKQGNEFIFAPQPFALEAKNLNAQLVENKFITIEFDVVKRDKYGRLLGYCFVSDTFVNARLIEEGVAVLYTFPPNVKYVDTFLKLQKEARQDKKGIWARYDTIDHTQAHRYINQIRTVRGRVLDTYQSPKVTFLNFGSDYRTDFTVVIFKNVLQEFHKRGINPLSYYKGKLIEVTGRIKEYNGPEIIVNSPLEIEVIDEKRY